MDKIFLFVAFAVPLVWSPGPVNILLAGLGANHGIRKNMPFVFGLICSATLISVICLLGFQVVLQNQIVYQGLIIAGSLYIMYLAIKLYRLRPSAVETNAVAHRFHDGLLVTLLNPKFYAMVTAIFAQFVESGVKNAAIVLLGFILILLIAHIAWLAVGATLKETAKNPARLHVLNKITGVLLFGFALYFLFRYA